MNRLAVVLATQAWTLSLLAGCATVPRESPALERPPVADSKDLPPEYLTLGQEKRLSLKEVNIDANLLLTEKPELYELELKLDVPGDWWRSVAWDEKELSARLLFEDGSESKGWNRSEEGLCWSGCLHGWSAKSILVFSKAKGDQIPGVLEIKVFNSHRLLRLQEH